MAATFFLRSFGIAIRGLSSQQEPGPNIPSPIFSSESQFDAQNRLCYTGTIADFLNCIHTGPYYKVPLDQLALPEGGNYARLDWSLIFHPFSALNQSVFSFKLFLIN